MIKKIKKIEKNNSVWTREEQKNFNDLLIEYGPKLYVNDFRCLISLDEKTDKDIILLKSKHIEYEYTVNYSKNIFSPPASESFQISFNFFSEIDKLNLDEFYCEDQSTIKAMKFCGLKRCLYSPLLQTVF